MPSKLSAVLICRNEQANIGPCLDSIRRGVDEIVVLDTGSTDDTPLLARKHGADVVASEPQWLVDLGEMTSLGDFAAARNRALELASGDWALIVDADHRYVWPTLDAVREAMRFDQHDTYSLWYHMATRPSARPVDVVSGRQRYGKPFASLALFRRGLGGPWYEGVIHETVARWEERQHAARGTTRGFVTKSRIADYGHAPDIRASLNKNRRNTLLLERAVRVRPDDPVPMTYLALEYATANDPRALAMSERAWMHLGHPQLIGAHLLRLCVARTWSWLRQNRPETAWETLNEWDAREGVEHPDVFTMRGMTAEALGLRDAAVAYFRRALTPTPTDWAIRYLLPEMAQKRLRELGAE
jgi:hypothetical protein